jgi:hypothetical protein
LYPWSTTDFWRRCLFPVWSHWHYSTADDPAHLQSRSRSSLKVLAARAIGLAMVGTSLALLYSQELPGSFTDAANSLPYLQATSLWKQIAGIR